MSDLSPDKQPQPQRARRATRPKTKASTPRRATNPAASPANKDTLAESTPAQEESAAADDIPEIVLEGTANLPEEDPPQDAPIAKRDIKVGKFTILSRPIVLWAVIIGVVSLVFTIAPGLILTAFGVTQKDLDNNSSLQTGLGCFSLIFSFALPFAGGWRATIHQGDWKEGGVTASWSAVVFAMLLLILNVIFAAVAGQMDQINGNFFVGLLEGLVFQMFLSFGLGAMGGWYSVWQRRRRAQQQELLTSSS